MAAAFDLALVYPGLPAVRRALARWGGSVELDDEESVRRFGVGIETLLRFERDEVDLEPEIAAQVWHGLLQHAPRGGYGHGPSAPRGVAAGEAESKPPPPPDRAGDEAAGEGPLLRGFFLVNQPGHGWRIGFWWRGRLVRLDLADARTLAEGIAPLIAQHDERFPA